jgi:tetratricopeptide (TPR) repeat protein
MLSEGAGILAETFPTLRTRIGFPDRLLQLAPAFHQIQAAQFGPASSLADRFLDGFPPNWGDLAAQFDLPRELYDGPRGLRSAVGTALNAEQARLTLFSIVGVAGAGKSTMLRRLAYDAAVSGFSVLSLRPDWVNSSIPIFKQLVDMLEFVGTPSIVILDNAAQLFRDEQLRADVIEDLLSRNPNPTVLIAADEPQHWYAIDRKNIGTHENFSHTSHHLGQLSEAECELLVDHLIKLETNGNVTMRAGAFLDRDARLSLCKRHAQRQMLIALLQLRHGKGFITIIRNEFERLAQFPSYQAAYGTASFAQTLFGSVPETLLLRINEIKGFLEIGNFWRQMEQLLTRTEVGIVVRHKRIAREIVNIAFSDPSAAQSALSGLFGSADPSFQREANFVNQAFSSPGQYRRYLKQFDWSPAIVDQFYEAILGRQPLLPGYYKKLIYTSWGQALRALNKNDTAIAKFKAALELDSGYGFALRQWAWAEHSNGKFVEAAVLAIQAAELESGNPIAQEQCARILSLNTLANFRLAGGYYERTLELDSQSEITRKRFDEWKTVNEQILPVLSNLQEDKVLPRHVAEVLRPGLSYLRNIVDPKSNEVRQALHRRLFAMQEDTAADEGEIRELIGNINVGRDKKLRAVVSCNIARSRYLEWYHTNTAVDHDEVEKLFKESIESDGENPFSYCWYGTFLKEVRENYTESMRAYKTALHRANKSKSDWLHQHPLILNNIALQLMDECRLKLKTPDVLYEAQKLVRVAIERLEARKFSFYWPYSTAKELEAIIGAHERKENELRLVKVG